MKKLLFLLFIVLLFSCSDDFKSEQNSNVEKVEKEPGMQRVVASSTEEIQNLISQLQNGNESLTRAQIDNKLSNNEDLFVSLVEANRKQVMESLTQEQRDSIANDDEELEFCPSDSVIADVYFAQLLNAEREIQVGSVVYKYMENGVAYTDVEHASDLKSVEDITNTIDVTEDNEGVAIPITKTVTFKPMEYEIKTYDGDDEDNLGRSSGSSSTNSGSTNSSTVPITILSSSENEIKLSNGVRIGASDIRNVNYNSKGDGSFFHRMWNGIWGRNIVAKKKFSNRRQMVLNFYDQNYIIYANIGTKLKMQKKVCGIWWNIKCPEMIHGWETITMRYHIPQPISPSTFVYQGMKNPTISTYDPFPFTNEKIILLHIPYINYDFSTKDINFAFKAAAKTAYSKASAWLKSKVNDPYKLGLFCYNDNYAYIIHGPFARNSKNVKTMESKTYSKWFPGSCEFQFSLGSSVNFKNVKISTNDGVDLYRGTVVGIINYNGKWLAARITKNE